MIPSVRMWNEAGEFVDVNPDHPNFAAYRARWPLESPPEVKAQESTEEAPKRRGRKGNG